MRSEIPKSLEQRLPRLESYVPIPMSAHDVVIHAPGFEDRTMSVVDSIQPKPGSRGVLLDYRPFNAKNRLVDVRSGLVARGVSVSDSDILIYDRFDPEDFEARLRTHLVLREARRVLIESRRCRSLRFC